MARERNRVWGRLFSPLLLLSLSCHCTCTIWRTTQLRVWGKDVTFSTRSLHDATEIQFGCLLSGTDAHASHEEAPKANGMWTNVKARWMRWWSCDGVDLYYSDNSDKGWGSRLLTTAPTWSQRWGPHIGCLKGKVNSDMWRPRNVIGRTWKPSFRLHGRCSQIVRHARGTKARSLRTCNGQSSGSILTPSACSGWNRLVITQMASSQWDREGWCDEWSLNNMSGEKVQ